MKDHIDIIAIDRDWQYPAITEKHAFYKVKELVPYAAGSVYFAFPWATLIDLLRHQKLEAESLIIELRRVADQLKSYKLVITTCQHAGMLQHQYLFDIAGVNFVFWSHATMFQNRFNLFPSISIMPFPLYPVQSEYQEISVDKKDYLCSFVGAKDDKYYLTNSRSLILENIAEVKGAYVKGRDSWHYHNIVLKKQINQISLSKSEQKIEESNSMEYRKIMANTVFSLCPSGSGPNSIRLWESIETGAIPVVLADSYLHPGDKKIWQTATISCKENKQEITLLPDRLKAIKKDILKIEEITSALSKIKQMYGKDYFVHDIVQVVVAYSTGEDIFKKKQSIFIKLQSLIYDSKVLLIRTQRDDVNFTKFTTKIIMIVKKVIKKMLCIS